MKRFLRTEFLLSLLATIAGLVILAGATGTVGSIAGAALAAIGAAGYTASRAGEKKVRAAIEATGRPGIKTTEFWLSAVAAVGGVVVPELADAGASETVQQIAGFALSGLAAAGYTVQQGDVKSAQAQGDVDEIDDVELGLHLGEG